MFKNFIADLKENWMADVLFVLSGTVVGFVIKYLVENLF